MYISVKGLAPSFNILIVANSRYTKVMKVAHRCSQRSSKLAQLPRQLG
jgi:hypothetical protein